ncbi:MULTISPECIES: ABC transporter permease [unclassified Kaistella]|uniref:ABC transporter permease n=1 Tax=unclassified Kaistella TaxID=2762626 RepID=UPI002735825C|nr:MULTISPECIES: ABC transporter permease [unclassified Kaistella]MDP2453529.1 ABC transporter permease [Kaistella sp. SH11-4b]MDP2456586.1 ABC transporter permease [Kaistella sp. SH40-3]MDP2459342.1 ABC transporter permease [Kaistella sp. SH19-2b]
MFRTLFILIKKEFLQIFRNKSILAIIFVMPVIQLVILPLAANYEIKDIKIAVVDHDKSTQSRELIRIITASGYFKIMDYGENYNDAYQEVEKDKIDLILEIPNNFEKDLVRENNEKVVIAINAINGTKAGLSASYLGQILQNYNQQIQLEMNPELETVKKNSGLEIVPKFWFNETYNYRLSLVPGILAFLVTLIGGYLTALNIVEEKEIGTIEQINVSPIKKRDFILGKLIPFWILSMVAFTIGLLVTIFVYKIQMQGSYLLLYAFISVYLIAILGMGLLASVYSDTQQQSMFMVFFFMMIFILMSGLFTPTESMTDWAKYIAYLNPVTYGVDGVRLIMLKDSGFMDLLPHFGFIIGLAIVVISWSVLRYHKTS